MVVLITNLVNCSHTESIAVAMFQRLNLHLQNKMTASTFARGMVQGVFNSPPPHPAEYQKRIISHRRPFPIVNFVEQRLGWGGHWPGDVSLFVTEGQWKMFHKSWWFWQDNWRQRPFYHPAAPLPLGANRCPGSGPAPRWGTWGDEEAIRGIFHHIEKKCSYDEIYLILHVSQI